MSDACCVSNTNCNELESSTFVEPVCSTHSGDDTSLKKHSVDVNQ